MGYYSLSGGRLSIILTMFGNQPVNIIKEARMSTFYRRGSANIDLGGPENNKNSLDGRAGDVILKIWFAGYGSFL